MPQIFSIKISDNIAALLSTPEPVVALNLMGLNMLSGDHFNPNHSVFWCDGVMAKIACKLANIPVKRKPGRTLLAETLKYLSVHEPQRPIAILGSERPTPQFSQLLKKDPVKLTLPWFASFKDIEELDFSKLSVEFIIFISIASPKQEWIAGSIYKKVGAKCYCIGGALNMLEGHEKIAPLILQNLGLEWLYRLFKEPKRRLYRLFLSLPRGVLNLLYYKSIIYFR